MDLITRSDDERLHKETVPMSVAGKLYKESLRTALTERDALHEAYTIQLKRAEAAESALCTAVEALSAMRSAFYPTCGESDVACEAAERLSDKVLLSSIRTPCRHVARVEALEKAIAWAHAPVNVFAFDPDARDMFLAELDRLAAAKGEGG